MTKYCAGALYGEWLSWLWDHVVCLHNTDKQSWSTLYIQFTHYSAQWLIQCHMRGCLVTPTVLPPEILLCNSGPVLLKWHVWVNKTDRWLKMWSLSKQIFFFYFGIASEDLGHFTFTTKLPMSIWNGQVLLLVKGLATTILN